MTSTEAREIKAELDSRSSRLREEAAQIARRRKELQAACPHPNKITVEDAVYGTESCPDCGYEHYWELDGFANMMR